MPKILVVTNPFAGKDAGDTITDPAEISAILAGENAHSVVAADAPEPQPVPKPAKE